MDFALTAPGTACNHAFTADAMLRPWATGRKVWQGTVTPSRRRTPGSIPGSPTIFPKILNFVNLQDSFLFRRRSFLAHYGFSGGQAEALRVAHKGRITAATSSSSAFRQLR